MVLCQCGCFMRVKRNSVTVEECLDDGAPYKLWSADLWACPTCGAEVITGFGRAPLAEHWQADYAATRERRRPVYLSRRDQRGVDIP